MTDQPISLSPNSPEEVAYRLLKTIASNEGKTLTDVFDDKASADRQWLLSTYKECLLAVQRPFSQ